MASPRKNHLEVCILYCQERSIFGTADKTPDFFLRRKRVLAKYTKEEKQKAIDLYIRYCKQTTKVIKELGYPNERHTLVSWYRVYK